MDFNPDLSDDNINKPKEEPKQELIINRPIEEAPSFVIEQSRQNKDMLSMGGLLGVTKSHVEDDFRCKETIKRIEDTLDDNYHLMSIKDLLEYLKIKQREREFHTDCIFKAYAILQRTDMAKEYMAGSNRKERIIEVSDRKRITGLLNMLNSTD